MEQIRIHGMWRCCIKSIQERPDREVEPKEGDVHWCKYCKDKAVFRNGAWEWAGRRNQ